MQNNANSPNDASNAPTKPKRHTIKLLMLGDSAVGKTSLLQRFTLNSFSLGVPVSVGVDFSTKVVKLANGSEVIARIWDPSGQEQYGTVVSLFFRKTDGVVLVYDVTSRESFDSLSERWLHQLAINSADNVPMILVGNKADTVGCNREVSLEMGVALAQKLGIGFFETSAKDDLNVTRMYNNIVSAAVHHLVKKDVDDNDEEKKRLEEEKKKSLVDADNHYDPPASFCSWFCWGLFSSK